MKWFRYPKKYELKRIADWCEKLSVAAMFSSLFGTPSLPFSSCFTFGLGAIIFSLMLTKWAEEYKYDR